MKGISSPCPRGLGGGVQVVRGDFPEDKAAAGRLKGNVGTQELEGRPWPEQASEEEGSTALVRSLDCVLGVMRGVSSAGPTRCLYFERIANCSAGEGTSLKAATR